ncbi:DNA replication protein [Acinetobacter baumannii]|nr:DNA replication protein [Acinetobacter baumannii]
MGKITKDADGKLDVSDLVVLYGSHVNTEQKSTGVHSEIVVQLEQLKNENNQLKQLLAVNEMLVNQLQQQIHDLRQDKENLFHQLSQKKLENKDAKKGLISKLFGS